MSTSPWAVGFEYRMDVKCGNSAISPGEECHVGQATEVTSKRSKRMRRALAIGAGVAGAAAGAYLLTRRREGVSSSSFKPNEPKTPSSLSPDEQEKINKWANDKVRQHFGGSPEEIARRHHNEVKRRAAERWIKAKNTKKDPQQQQQQKALPPARSERGRNLGNGKRGYSWEEFLGENLENVTRDINRLKKRKDSLWDVYTQNHGY